MYVVIVATKLCAAQTAVSVKLSGLVTTTSMHADDPVQDRLSWPLSDSVATSKQVNANMLYLPAGRCQS